MIPPNAIKIVKELHAHYVARTGYDIAYNIARENTWREWCQWGGWLWTCDDLTRVIGYLRKKISRGERNEGALKFQNLIGRPDNFEEDLNLAREEAKKVFGGRPAAKTVHVVLTDEEAKLDADEAAQRWKEMFGKNP